MTSGIYALYWEHNLDKVYIGQSIYIESRIYNHINALKNNYHTNSKLQHCYNLYGLPIDYIIEEVSEISLLNAKEASWIKEFDSIATGYNISEVPGYAYSEDNYPNSKYEKLTLLQVFRELRNPKVSYKELSIKYGINISTIRAIARKAEHLWLHIKYPNISKLISEVSTIRQSYSRTTGTVYKVYDSNNKLYLVDNISQFCRKYSLNIGNFASMLYGNIKTCKGWKLQISTKPSYTLYNKDLDITETIEVQKTFCEKYSIDSGSLSRLLKGQYKSTKGWVLKNTFDSINQTSYNNINE